MVFPHYSRSCQFRSLIMLIDCLFLMKWLCLHKIHERKWLGMMTLNISRLIVCRFIFIFLRFKFPNLETCHVSLHLSFHLYLWDVVKFGCYCLLAMKVNNGVWVLTISFGLEMVTCRCVHLAMKVLWCSFIGKTYDWKKDNVVLVVLAVVMISCNFGGDWLCFLHNFVLLFVLLGVNGLNLGLWCKW
jgi:hypothetical protein